MTDPQRELKKIWYLCNLIYLITWMIAMYQAITQQNLETLGMTIVAALTPLIVPMLFRICHFKPVYEIYLVSTIFTYFASLLGSSFHWYALAGFDKALHSVSGIIFVLTGALLFFHIRRSNVLSTSDYQLFLLFINTFNLAAALLWEFFEYAMLILFRNDCINHYTTGVHDAMTDCLCAFILGLFTTGMLVHRYRRKKPNIFTRFYESFYEQNTKDVSR